MTVVGWIILTWVLLFGFAIGRQWGMNRGYERGRADERRHQDYVQRRAKIVSYNFMYD